MTELALGDLRITGLTDIDSFDVPLTTIFPEGDPASLTEALDWLSPHAYSDGIVHLKIRSWLLRIGGRSILVDTCVGAHKERPNWQAWHRREGQEWLAALAQAGLCPEDIDVVFCTHLHADHVGWNTKLLDGRWVPTFPNARYIVGRAEFEYWQREAATQDRHGSFADSVLPVHAAGQIDLVDDGWDLADGLSLHLVPGHTAGQMSMRTREGAVFCGDAIHSPVQLAQPDWSSAFCSDPDQARITRKAMLEELADSDRLLIPAHFPAPGWCRVKRDGDAYRMVP